MKIKIINLIIILILLNINCCNDNNNTNTNLDGKYKVTKICNQTWMTENLDVSYYRNGDSIPQVQDAKEWSKLSTGAWCYYNNEETTSNIYGKLYNWYSVNDPRGLAPKGWHVSTDIEWLTITQYLGGDSIAGGKLKETGTLHWKIPNAGANNKSGFSGLPGGYRSKDGPFYNYGIRGYWWTSTTDSNTYPWGRVLLYDYTCIIRDYGFKQEGFSIRCVKDK